MSMNEKSSQVSDEHSKTHDLTYVNDVESSTINERALIRRLDWKLLPAAGIIYLVSFIDRSNVGNARIEGLIEDIHMTGDQFLTGLTLFFIGYVLFEIPNNIVLKRTTPKFWLPTLTLAFGVITTLTGITQNLAGFFVVRFFLGIVEGGIFPGIIFYLSMWYTRRERQFRLCLSFSGASLAGAFGGILAWAIAHMSGVAGYLGWRWIFIIEGLMTVVIALLAYFFISNYPASAGWLSSAERSFILKRLAVDSDSSEHEGFTWGNVRAALTDPKCWMYAFGAHFPSMPLFTLSLFMPSIIKALGYSSASAQLLTIPPYAVATVLMAGVAWYSERIGRRQPFILASPLIAAVGYCILLSNTDPVANPGRSYVGTFFAAAGIYPTVGLVLSMTALNVGGQTKRAVAAALQTGIGNCGAIIGTQIYRTEDAPRYVVGHSVALAYCLASSCLTAFTWWYLARENKRKQAAIDGAEGVVGGTGGLKGDDDPGWLFMT